MKGLGLVDIADYGIKGINYYVARAEQLGVTKDELASIGITNSSALVRREMLPSLLRAQSDLKQAGYDILVKDAYRSPELYKLVQRKRYERDGRTDTDKTLNAVEMPHASGSVVDINLIDIKTGQELELWDKSDWPDGAFVDYYKNHADVKSQEYQKLQTLLIKTMLKNGFKLGKMREFWHFVYGEAK
ncbi:hypothetical protein FWF48_02385 [Candidatus Saccharibacteria bacterium]|nr:hypothetical protein [Candidatus Saccharibacteria bacterium]